jgi:predicted dehydrogenase
MNSLKAGIIGLGVGEAHIAGYRSHPRCEVVSICDQNPARLAEVQAKNPGIRGVTRGEEILDDASIGVVSIASYDTDHHAQIVRALKNGKHVFVEKPFCMSESEAADIRRVLAERPHLKISSNLILRKSPRFVELREQIQSGKLGKIFHVEGDYQYGRIHKITQGWRSEIDFYSVVYGGGVHVIDLLLWLTGDTVTEVAAFGNRICSEGSAFRFNDMVISILRFKSGMVGKVSANFGCVLPHFHSIHVYGTQGTFQNGTNGGHYFASRDPQVAARTTQAAYPGVHKGDLIRSFVDSIVGGRGSEPEVTADDLFRSMSVCFAIEKAAQTGGTIPVSYL